MAWLLDTNVLSEVRRRRPDPKVLRWFADQHEAAMFISVVSLGEIRAGIETKRLKDAAQAAAIERWFTELHLRFSHRILPVTEAIADQWGRLCPAQPLSDNDGFVAATGLVHDLTVVTRNLGDFKRSGVRLLNPWEFQG